MRLVISLDGKVLDEVTLSKPRTTIGRRAYNDIVIDHLGVSGEHAAVVQSPQGLRVEDLQSTNGTYVNDQAVEQQLLRPGDVIGVGRFRLLVADGEPAAGQHALADSSGPVTLPAAGSPPARADTDADAVAQSAVVRVLDGAAAGREVLLTQERTTFGKPGVLVVAIERQGQAHVLSQVEGEIRARLNGAPLPEVGAPLHDGDVVDLMGTRLQFNGG